jgi:hypothetical protein
MRRKLFDILLYSLLVIACLAACGLFTLLPIKALDTGLVYQGF